jgi:hypothetical protein
MASGDGPGAGGAAATSGSLLRRRVAAAVAAAAHTTDGEPGSGAAAATAATGPLAAAPPMQQPSGGPPPQQPPQQQPPQRQGQEQQWDGAAAAARQQQAAYEEAALAAAVASARRRGAAALALTPLLQFVDRQFEGAFKAWSQSTMQAGDLCNLSLSALLIVAALLHSRGVGARAPAAGAPPPTPGWLGPPPAPAALACGASAAAAALLAGRLLCSSSGYGRWRSAALAALRVYRVAIWVAFMRPRLALLSPHHLTLRAFLLSPASGNLWFSLFFPLPLEVHLPLLLLTTGAAVLRTPPVGSQLLASPELPTQTAAAYERLTRMTR